MLFSVLLGFTAEIQGTCPVLLLTATNYTEQCYKMVWWSVQCRSNLHWTDLECLDAGCTTRILVFQAIIKLFDWSIKKSSYMMGINSLILKICNPVSGVKEFLPGCVLRHTEAPYFSAFSIQSDSVSGVDVNIFVKFLVLHKGSEWFLKPYEHGGSVPLTRDLVRPTRRNSCLLVGPQTAFETHFGATKAAWSFSYILIWVILSTDKAEIKFCQLRKGVPKIGGEFE